MSALEWLPGQRLLKRSARSVAKEIEFRRSLHQVEGLLGARIVASTQERPRLNILLPAIAPARVFGGISTATRLFHELRDALGYAVDVRMIVFDLDTREQDAARFDDYRLTAPAEDGDAVCQVSPYLPHASGPLAVRSRDVFVATYWTTALAARSIIRQQRALFGDAPDKLLYLIQDFEPGFYAWSSEYALADSTYRDDGSGTIAIFNTTLLRDFFTQQGHAFTRSYCFQPQMNASLRAHLPAAADTQRKRRILVYGRPSIARNGFALIVEALRVWAREPAAAGWSVMSAGEQHGDVPLGAAHTMISRGKLTLEDYARALSESAVGLSLMFSPHPSYPPLEMAHFGVHTVTNGFANKDLAAWHDNIASLRDIGPASIASALHEACARFERDPRSGPTGRPRQGDFLAGEPAFPFLPDLARDVLAMLGRVPATSA